MKFLVAILFLFGIIILRFFWRQQQFSEISAIQARDNIQRGKYDFIVDVRTDKEWNQHHLPNTLHIPIGDLVKQLPQQIPNKDARILFVCQRGIRASGVVTMVHKMGYRNVQALTGNYREIGSES
jgi:hydroxyacylglutathione hydrolase